uniref:Putative secreted peptide n=1 Tax=Anopheles braziliensis TaxID=58242 RepID=A0A2M3ZXH4_9DIPT
MGCHLRPAAAVVWVLFINKVRCFAFADWLGGWVASGFLPRHYAHVRLLQLCQLAAAQHTRSHTSSR